MKLIIFCLFLALSFRFSQVHGVDAPETGDGSVNNNENNINNNGVGVSKVTSTRSPDENVPSKVTPKPDSDTNNSTHNATQEESGNETFYQKAMKNKPMLMRSFFVLLGVSSIVVLYFVVKMWKSKRRQSKSRKYGLITSSGADLEMEPLDQDVDDDDEMTMFERHK